MQSVLPGEALNYALSSRQSILILVYLNWEFNSPHWLLMGRVDVDLDLDVDVNASHITKWSVEWNLWHTVFSHI